MPPETVLITGGAGFVGSELVRQVLGDGARVVVYDNLSFGRLANLPSHPHLIVEEGDVTDLERVQQVVNACAPAKVFHLAALHFIPYCTAHPQETLRVNVEGTANVLEACRRPEVKVVVHVSTAAVYGVQDTPHAELDFVDPIDVYGVSKVGAEYLVKLFHRQTGIRCAVVRLFNAFGPRETNPHLIPEIMRQLSGGDQVELGNLDPRRDYIHTSDVCKALRRMAEAVDYEFEAFNVATGHSHSARELMDVFADILHRKLTLVSTEDRRRASERPRLSGDISKIVRILDWQPAVSLADGLRDLLESEGMLPVTVPRMPARATVLPA